VTSPTRLPPDQWFPAGRADITARRVALGDGLSLRVLEAGPADGAAVLLLHGWAISAYLWRHTIPALAAAGYRVIAADLPGCGQSDAPTTKGSYTLAALTSRGWQLLDALGVADVAIVAQSMGGRIALEMALRQSARVRSLVLFGPVGFGDIPPAQAFAPFLPKLPGTLPSLLVTRQTVDIVQRRVHGKLGWFTERDTDEYWAPTQFPNVVRAQMQMLAEFDFLPLDASILAMVQTPTLVVFGTEDRTVKPVHAERLAKLLPHGRLEWVEGGGHVIMEEAPERANTMVCAFLQP
jgi:pimeloyl-ACP methyl ester carboxylesterase